MNESKHDRFVRLAQFRTIKAAKHIRLVANLHNDMVYSYTEKEIKKIFSFLRNEIDEAEKKFMRRKRVRTLFRLEK